MQTDKEKIEQAKWLLERNLSWIAAAEVKVGVIVALDTAMLAGLGTAFGAASKSDREGWVMLFAVIATACLVIGLFSAAMTVLPRVTGPVNSLVFFGRVGALKSSDFADRFTRASQKDVLNDWLAQAHRNAQIACDKFKWVRTAMWFSFLSILPWLGAIVMTVSQAKLGT